MRYICALTIAGSDSCGGAGVQADIKTMSALGVYAASAITAITVQNSAPVLVWRLGCGSIAEVLHTLAVIEGNAGPVFQVLALQEVDAIVIPLAALAHAHIGGNHDVALAIVHAGDVGIAGTAFDAGVFFWVEDWVAIVDVLIVVAIT